VAVGTAAGDETRSSTAGASAVLPLAVDGVSTGVDADADAGAGEATGDTATADAATGDTATADAATGDPATGAATAVVAIRPPLDVTGWVGRR
jgi:hypothetical protein